MASKRRLKAAFIHAQRDNSFRESFEPFIKSVQKQYLREVDYYTIEGVTDLALQRIGAELDVLFVAMSMDLLTTHIMTTGAFGQLIRYHFMNRLLIIPIHYRTLSLPENQNRFRNMEWAPGKEKPIESQTWDSPDQAYGAATEKIRGWCAERQEYIAELESNWEEARANDNIPSYAEFIKNYPHCWFVKDAKSRRDELEEKKLWDTALSKGTIEAYFNYLLKSPFNRNRFEAAEMIYTLEGDRDKNWKEAAKQDQLELYYQHKNRFGKGNTYQEANQRIDNILDRPKKPESEIVLRQLDSYKNQFRFSPAEAPRHPADAPDPSIPQKEINLNKLDSSFMQIKALQHLWDKESLAYEAYGTHTLQLWQRLNKLTEELKNREYLHLTAFGLIGFMVVLVLYSVFPTPPLQYLFSRGFRGTTFDERVYLILIAAIAGVFTYSLLLWRYFLRGEMKFVKDAQSTMKSLSVLIRFYVLVKDIDSAQAIIRYFRKVENMVDKIFAKSPFDYLTQTSQTVKEDLAKVRKKIGVREGKG